MKSQVAAAMAFVLVALAVALAAAAAQQGAQGTIDIRVGCRPGSGSFEVTNNTTSVITVSIINFTRETPTAELREIPQHDGSRELQPGGRFAVVATLIPGAIAEGSRVVTSVGTFEVRCDPAIGEASGSFQVGGTATTATPTGAPATLTAVATATRGPATATAAAPGAITGPATGKGGVTQDSNGNVELALLAGLALAAGGAAALTVARRRRGPELIASSAAAPVDLWRF
jgi:hypothetical protein